MLFVTTVLVMLIMNSSCLAQIDSGKHEYRSLWNISESIYLPIDIPISFDLLAKFSAAYFDSLDNQMSQDKLGFFIPLSETFISDRDTFIIGFHYSYESNEYIHFKGIKTDLKAMLGGVIASDDFGKIRLVSPVEYRGLRQPSNFKGMTAMRLDSETNTISNYSKLPLTRNSVFDGVNKIADQEPIINAYQELYTALYTDGYLQGDLDFRFFDFYFTKTSSYCYDRINKRIYTYHESSKELTYYTLPKNNEVIKRLGIAVEEELYFSASVNDYLVFSTPVQDWCIMIVDTKSDKVYLFYTEYITNKVGVIDVKPIGNGGSGFSIYPTDDNVYVKAITQDGSFYVIRVNLDR
jgi:hypothetical protein